MLILNQGGEFSNVRGPLVTDNKKKLTLSLFLLIMLTDFGESLSSFLLKKGVISTEIFPLSAEHIFHFTIVNIGSILIWLGVLTYFFNFFLWMRVLSKLDLSVAVPIGSTSYIMVPLAAFLFLHETVTPLRWIGIFAIILGIYFVSRSKTANDGTKVPEAS